jgi:hypothetical protein
MKRILAALVFSLTSFAAAQTSSPTWFQVPVSLATRAATPTFSPTSGAVSNPTTVTASSTTSGAGCTMYFDTNSTPATAQTTYSVTTLVTLYAQVRGCTGYSNSAIASASYTISAPTPSVVHTTANASACNFGSCSLTLSSPATAGNELIVLLMQSVLSYGTWVVKDNNLNSLTQCSYGPKISTDGNSYPTTAFSYTVPAGGASSLSLTFTNSYLQMLVVEVANPSSTSPVCQAMSNDGYVYTNQPNASATPTVSPSIAIATFFGGNSFNAGSGWTAVGTDSTTGNNFFAEYKTVTGLSAVTATAVNSNGANEYITIW